VVQLDNFPGYAEAAGAKFPAYAAHMLDLHARRRDTIMAAYDAGVPIYAGTDAGGVLPHGGIAGEVLELAGYGFPAVDALGAASWRAREWLGLPGTLSEGSPADFVVLPRDPLEDLTALREPVRVVLRGAVVA
jgi:imidazolonepropionase-like amidohydrolase